MRNTVWPQFAALAAVFSLAACGGKTAPEPAAAEPAPPEPAQREEQVGAGEPAPTEPQPTEEPAPEPQPDPTQAKTELAAAEKSAFEMAEPVFKQHCARCHVKGEKKSKAKTLGHFDMTTYPFGGHHADEISAKIRKVLAIGGGKPTMPKDDRGAVQGEELSLIAAWADAYDRAHAGGAHEDRGHGAHDHGSGHKH